MKRLCLITTLLFATQAWPNTPWKLKLTNSEERVNLYLDLYSESIEVPGMELFGPMNGYLGGQGVYGVWMVTSFDIVSSKEARIRLSNDLGSETQAIRLTQQTDSTYLFEQTDGSVIKRAVNRKLVKIPQKIILRK